MPDESAAIRERFNRRVAIVWEDHHATERLLGEKAKEPYFASLLMQKATARLDALWEWYGPRM